MPAKYFIDTNIFVYTFSPDAPAKRKTALSLVGAALEEGNGLISSQVVQEFLSTALHKFKKPLSWGEAHSYFEEVLAPLCGLYAEPDLYRRTLRVQHETGYHFYDSLIIAAAVEGGCKTLYSEDMQDGQKVSGLTIKNPFRG